MIYLIDEKLTDKKLTDDKLYTQLILRELNDENSKHLKALRPDEGERVAFLNLKGSASIYLVKQAKPLILAFDKNIRSEASSVKTHLFIAPPVGPALEQAIEQATEVGYDFIHFVRAERVQYPKGKDVPLARLKRIVQASCKQCARLWAPLLDERFLSFGQAMIEASNENIICADESVARNSWGSIKREVKGNFQETKESRKDLAIFIGPEGGWSEEERRALHGAACVFSLGPHILRVSTAVVSAYVLAWKENSYNG